MESSAGREDGAPPRLEEVRVPPRHEFEVTVPDGTVVRGYVTSYEIWDVFVRVNVAVIDRPLQRSNPDGFALRLHDGSFARFVQGNGGAGQRVSFWGTAFARPPGPQTVTLGFARDRTPPTATRSFARDWRPRPEADPVFTPIMDLLLP